MVFADHVLDNPRLRSAVGVLSLIESLDTSRNSFRQRAETAEEENKNLRLRIEELEYLNEKLNEDKYNLAQTEFSL